MPYILWTGLRLRKGEILNTKIFCSVNRQAVLEAGPVREEVESFLASMRAIMEEEQHREWLAYTAEVPTGQKQKWRGLPDRTCAISAVTWPEGMAYNPPDGRGFCYQVKPVWDRALWAVVAEDWADFLAERWDRLPEEKAQEVAAHYWSGVPRRYGPGSTELLVEGDVLVEGECPAD